MSEKRPSAHEVVCELLVALSAVSGPCTTTDLAEAVPRDPRTLRSALDTLRRYGIVERSRGAGSRPDAWRLLPARLWMWPT